MFYTKHVSDIDPRESNMMDKIDTHTVSSCFAHTPRYCTTQHPEPFAR